MPHETRIKPRGMARRSFISRGNAAPPETLEEQKVRSKAHKKREEEAKKRDKATRARLKLRGGGGIFQPKSLKGVRQKTIFDLLK